MTKPSEVEDRDIELIILKREGGYFLDKCLISVKIIYVLEGRKTERVDETRDESTCSGTFWQSTFADLSVGAVVENVLLQ